MDIKAKVYEIQSWLRDISDDFADASFEINEFTVEHLYQLMQLNKKRDKHTRLKISDFEDKAEEYSSESKRIGDLLTDLGISESELTAKTKESLNELADIGNLLSLSTPRPEDYLMALSDLAIEDFQLEDKVAELNQQLRDMKAKYQNVCREAEKLAADVIQPSKAGSEEEDAFDIDVKIEAVKTQSKTFVSTTKALKQKLSASGIKKELTHEELKKLSDSVVKLAEEISEIKKKLQNFRDLPSSLPLAKEKIRAVQLEIQAMEEEFPVLQDGLL